jgi:hypothetical protein
MQKRGFSILLFETSAPKGKWVAGPRRFFQLGLRGCVRLQERNLFAKAAHSPSFPLGALFRFAADDDLSDSGVSEYEEIVEEEVDASVDDWALSRPDSSESNKRWSSISGQATRWASTPTSRSSRRNSFASRLGSPECMFSNLAVYCCKQTNRYTKAAAIGDVFEDSFAEPSIGDELMDIDKTPEAPNLDLSDASSPRKKGRASTTPAPKATKSVGSTKKADSPSKLVTSLHVCELS